MKFLLHLPDKLKVNYPYYITASNQVDHTSGSSKRKLRR
jgi:hypothetical protein